MIEAVVSGEIISSYGVAAKHPVTAAFEYDETDPHVIGVLFQWTTLGFEAEVYWEFGRDLVREMYDTGMAGCGDIVLAKLQDRVMMSLADEQGTAVLTLDPEPFRKFASDVFRLVPRGQEDMTDQIEEALEWILEREGK